MTAPTITRPANGSAYPSSVAELMPTARLLIEPETGKLPTRNGLMRELKIGAPKAREVLAALEAETTGPGDPYGTYGSEPATDPGPAEPVPTDEPDEDTPTVEPAAPVADPEPTTPDTVPVEPAAKVDTVASPQAVTVADPGAKVADKPHKAPRTWPLWLLALPAIVAIWSGWVGLGELSGFGMVRPLPGIADGFAFNSAITLPIGMEIYAAYALRVWLSGSVPPAAKQFARTSALGSLALGGLGQVAYHLMTAAGMTTAPWWITTLVACLPVAVLGMGAALAHLIKTNEY